MCVKSFEAGSLVEHTQCIANEIEGKQPCSSSDAMAIYEKQDKEGKLIYDASCFSCSQGFSPSQFASSSVGKAFLGEGEAEGVVRRSTVKPKDRITREEFENIKSKTDQVANGYLGLPDEVFKFYGHRLEKDDEGNVVKEYYPETQGGKFFGMKYRFLLRDGSKCFGRVGWTGQASDLSGQSKFKEGGKYVLVVGGERDKLAAHHMLQQYQVQRKQDMFNPIPVVSPTTGETSAYKQLQAQYDWLDSFENIILGFDSDDAGDEATQAALKVLPVEKVKIAKWSENDPFDLWKNGKSAQFLRDFYDAKEVIKSTVKTSKVADDEIEVELGRKKIPLPPFMKPLQDLMAGGIPLGYLINLGAGTGIGKTTIINEIIYYWIFNSPYKIGILSLELNAGQYQTMMLSRHIGKKLTLIEDPEEAVAFVQQPEIVKKRIELREDEYGEERYTILDDRDGDLESVAQQINKLITKHDCKLIVIDPLNDLFEGSTLESQTAFVKYLKTIIKDGISIFNVCHITKGRTQLDNKGNRILRQLTEDDFAGVSNIAKSGGCNILAVRDKYAEDELEKNTTHIEVPKCRWTGRSGNGGEWVYDNKTHTMVDKQQFLQDNPEYAREEVTHTITPSKTVVGPEGDVFDE